MEPTGLILNRFHVELILSIKDELNNNDLTSYWNCCINPELVRITH